MVVAQVEEPGRETGGTLVELGAVGRGGLAVRTLTDLRDALGLLLGNGERSGLDRGQDKELGGRSVGVHCARLFAVDE